MAENNISNGNYFKNNPDKVLGTPETKSKSGKPYTDRFGKPITKYKGSLKDLDKIKVSNHTIIQKGGGSASQTIKKPESKPLQAPLLVSKLADGIAQGEKDIIKRINKKRKKKSNLHQTYQKPEIYSCYEMIKRDMKGSNTDNRKPISEDEVKAFLWHQYHNKAIYMQGDWLKFLDPKALSKDQEESLLNNWMLNKIVFIENGVPVYAPFYLSGDIYAKKSEIDKINKEDFNKRYGKGTYEAQLEAINEAYEEIRKSALEIVGNENNSLDLIPTSEFCRNIHITTLDDEQQFKGLAHPKTDKFGYEVPFFENLEKNKWNHKTFESLSLTNAFVYWLIKYDGTITFKKQTSWQEIYKFFILKGNVTSGFKMNKRKKGDLNASEMKEYLKAHSAKNTRLSNAKSEGKRLFKEFLTKAVRQQDRRIIELHYNRRFNNSLRIDYDRIPIGFDISKFYPGDDNIEIRIEKREAVAFILSEGSGILAYDVGVGKTWSLIMIIAQLVDCGQVKRGLVVVPNQTYKQWITETKGILPHLVINDLYNLSQPYIDQLIGIDGKVRKLTEKSLTFLTYEGFYKLGVSEKLGLKLSSKFYEILGQESFSSGKKGANERLALQQKIESVLGVGNKDTIVDIDELGIDFFGLDEAHNFKNVFPSVKSSNEDDTKYEIQGSSSVRAIKAFIISQYIQSLNKGRNVVLLTATPVTNSPVEVYSMLAFVAYDKLKEGIVFDEGGSDVSVNNMVRFFDHFVKEETELVINASLNPVRKPIFKGWRNLKVLQKLLFKVINFKNADTKDRHGRQITLIRPNKYQLPFKGRYLEEGSFKAASANECIDITLEMSPLQKLLMTELKAYSEDDHYRYSDLAGNIIELTNIEVNTESSELTEEEKKDRKINEDQYFDENTGNDNEKRGVKIMRAVNLARSLAISPYLLKLQNPYSKKLEYVFKKPSYKEFVETSSKIKVTVEMIRMVKEYFESINKPVPGQVIYLDRGKEYLPLIKEYLVKEVGFTNNEVDLIKGGDSKKKTRVQNKFLGREYITETDSYVDIQDKDRTKVIIGTSSMREGMNLQRYSLVLYDLFQDWNPTNKIQIDGRIWRQGNMFYNCFIVTPTIADSMDIFMLQKNEEKVARIGELWNKDIGQNVMKTDEYNVEELKYHLISDPNVIAQMEADERAINLKDEKAFIDSQITIAETIAYEYNYVSEHEPKLRKIVDFWRPQREPVRELDKNQEKSHWFMTFDEYWKCWQKKPEIFEAHEDVKVIKKAIKDKNENLIEVYKNRVKDDYYVQIKIPLNHKIFKEKVENKKLSYRRAVEIIQSAGLEIPPDLKKPELESRTVETMIKLLTDIIRDQTDGEGKAISEYSDLISDVAMGQIFIKGDYNYGVEAPEWFTAFKAHYAHAKRKGKEKAVFKSKADTEAYIKTLKGQSEKHSSKIKEADNPEVIALRAAEIAKERKEKNIRYDTVKEVVEKFAQFKPKFTELRAVKTANEIPLAEIVKKMPPIKKGVIQTDYASVSLLESILERLPQTATMHTDNEGNYTPERLELHKKIKNEVKENAVCVRTKRQKPIAVLTGGVPGSGKSYFLKQYAPYLLSGDILKIDADEIRAKLPEYKGWNADQTHVETSALTKEILKEIGTPCITDIIYDGTMNKAKNYISLVRQLKDLGYKVFVIFVEVPGDIARTRVLNRFKESERYVPMRVVNAAIETGTAVYNDVKKLVDGYILVNGITSKIIEKKGEEIPKNRSYFNHEKGKERIKQNKLRKLAEKIKTHMRDKNWEMPTGPTPNKHEFKDRNDLNLLTTSDCEITWTIEYYHPIKKQLLKGQIKDKIFKDKLKYIYVIKGEKHYIPEDNIIRVISKK